MREETLNSTAVRQAIEGLRHMTVGQLKGKYRDVFGEDTRSNHKQFLFRRIAWRIQANAEGGLSERGPESCSQAPDRTPAASGAAPSGLLRTPGLPLLPKPPSPAAGSPPA